jgi:hypothetical protein
MSLFYVYIRILLPKHKRNIVTALDILLTELLWRNWLPYLQLQTFHTKPDITTSKMASQEIQGKLCQ